MAKIVKCKDCGEKCELGKSATNEQRGSRWVNVCDRCAGVTRDKYGHSWDADGRANGQDYQPVNDGAIEHVRWEDVKA